MAITVQSELVTAVANWLSRTDLASRVPEFIALAEAKLNRQLRVMDQETKSTTFSINSEYVAVPTGFLQVRSFQSSSGGTRYALKILPDEVQTDHYTTTGTPLYYSVVGGNFRFAPVPDGTYTATLVYYVKLTTLGTTGSNHNWLLDSHPDIYLYATLTEAAAYVQVDDNLLLRWKAAYDEGIATLKASNASGRWGGPGIQTRAV